VADGIDPHVDGVQAPHLHTVVDGATAETQLQQLPARHDPMLPLREFGDSQLNWATLTPYIGVNVAHLGHGGEDRAMRRAELRARVTQAFRKRFASAPAGALYGFVRASIDWRNFTTRARSFALARRSGCLPLAVRCFTLSTTQARLSHAPLW
jgi:hypothetical protein